MSSALYVHVPFCVKKCPYCAFKSAPPAPGEIENWLKSLLPPRPFMGRGAGGVRFLRGGEVATLYIGGGTPTILDESQWRRLGEFLRVNFDVAQNAEFTVEATPESLKDFHIEVWKEIGVTRVSLGVQSLDDGELRYLGRPHDAREAIEALRRLQSARAFRVSADLMFGLAGQTLRSWARSLRTLIDEGVTHISTYHLTIDDKTPFDGYKFYRFAQWFLPKMGFSQYEIASFAAPGHECRHNLAYWRQDEVMAIGEHAWGYSGGVRYRNYDYSERLDDDARAREAAILALRTREGIDKKVFVQKFGEKILEKIIFALEQIPSSCVAFSDGKISLTPKGMRVANQIWEKIV